ncbi:hypothetical protein PsorP6_009229 [Peronosclerospora sorghi]|uniref:Uncharacterized protein n=1 Tax=Peronosclerospora sorghi TaxID=230839 RepID=A0ACC0W0C3_9STRA|nr:hypothetical protein PsorP6_009229 [Peronosclerospora sorghi]
MQLQDLQKKIRAQDVQAIEDARVALDYAAARHRVAAYDANRKPSLLDHSGSEMGDLDIPKGKAPPTNNTMQRNLLDSVARVLSEIDRQALDTEVTALDLTKAIQHVKATSSPAMDSLQQDSSKSRQTCSGSASSWSSNIG